MAHCSDSLIASLIVALWGTVEEVDPLWGSPPEPEDPEAACGGSAEAVAEDAIGSCSSILPLIRLPVAFFSDSLLLFGFANILRQHPLSPFPSVDEFGADIL